MKKISTLTTVATFASTIIGVGIIAVIAFFLIHKLQYDHLAKDKKHSLEIANKALILPVWNYDEGYIEEILSSFIGDETDNVVAMRVVMLENGREFIKTSPQVNSPIDQLKKLEHMNVLKQNIVYRGRELATLEVYFSSANFNNSFNRIIAFIAFITFTLGVALAFVMNSTIKRLLTAPLNEIAQDAKKAGEGQYDINFKTHYTGELNIVTEAFNETLSALKERDSLLIQQNTMLEELVEKRTKERDEERLKSFQASRLAALGEMAGAIAHEINNPLTVIQNYSKNIAQALLNTERDDLIVKSQKIQSMSERIARIIKGLRSFSRDGKEDEHQFYPIEKFVDDLTCLCSSRAKDLEIDLSFDFDKNDLIFVNVTEIGQVLINLINNSIDAVIDLPEKWIKVKFFTVGDKTHITVTDSGAGISLELQDKIMDPFFTTKDLGKGTGLGLPISHRIISQHGGQFIYNSHSSHTEFIITLPIHKHPEQPGLQ